MKKILIFLCLLFCLNAVAETDDSLWKIIRHPLETGALEVQVNAMVKSGYLPTGINVEAENTLTILYVKNSQKIFDRWLLKYFDDMKSLSKECGDLIGKGWVPMGISKVDGGLFVIFVNIDLKVTEWTLATSNSTSEYIEATIRHYNDLGFGCFGISASAEGKIWYMFLKTPNSAMKKHEWAILPDDPATIFEVLDKFMALGWLPWGILRNAGMYNVLLFQ